MQVYEKAKAQEQQQIMKDQRQFANDRQSKILYPWRLTRAVPRDPDSFWAHPSKMPIPPPRRKKKTLSFAGLKDTFKKFVLPEKHAKETVILDHKPNEPIYATIRPVDRSKENKIGNNFQHKSTRPLPPEPDNLYENMRKYSLPDCNEQFPITRNKEFTSTNDLNRNSYKIIDKGQSATLPKKNFSYQDLNVGMPHGFDPMYRGYNGSTQSVYPGYCGHNMIMYCGHNRPNQCQYSFNRCCNQCSTPIHPYYNANFNSLSNSFEELTNRNLDDDNDDELTDDENEFDLTPNGRLSQNAKMRLRKAKMKRSQSTFTMYDNNMACTMNQTGKGNKSDLIKQKQSSPSPSIKSTKSSDRYRYSDISDSSSSSNTKRNQLRISKNENHFQMDNQINENEEIINELGQWSCRFCTYLNNSENNICEICCKTRLKLNQENVNNKKQIVQSASNANENESQMEIKSSKETEHEIVFDESFIREQLEIEKEIQRRKENELRIANENKVLENESTNENEIRKKTENTSKISMSSEENNNRSSGSQSTNDVDENDPEKIVARIIDEKINEKFNELKMTPSGDKSNQSADTDQTNKKSSSSSANLNDNQQNNLKNNDFSVQNQLNNSTGLNSKLDSQVFPPTNPVFSSNNNHYQQYSPNSNGFNQYLMQQWPPNSVLPVGMQPVNYHPPRKSSCSSVSSYNSANYQNIMCQPLSNYSQVFSFL